MAVGPSPTRTLDNDQIRGFDTPITANICHNLVLETFFIFLESEAVKADWVPSVAESL